MGKLYDGVCPTVKWEELIGYLDGGFGCSLMSFCPVDFICRFEF